jgi:hypothetical protein
MISNCVDAETGLNSRHFGQLSTLQPKDKLVSFLSTVQGRDIFARYTPALTYLQQTEADGLAVEKRGLMSAPGATTTASDQASNNFYGDNFASNNYLGLAQHPSTIEAAIDAAKTFGVNSAGSPLAFGATKYSPSYVGITCSSRRKSLSSGTARRSSTLRGGWLGTVL